MAQSLVLSRSSKFIYLGRYNRFVSRKKMEFNTKSVDLCVSCSDTRWKQEARVALYNMLFNGSFHLEKFRGHSFNLHLNCLTSSIQAYVAFIKDMRKPYKDKGDTFSEDSLSCKEPIGLFSKWFELACNSPEIREPNAMVLATADKHGKPSARFVLLKGYGKDGFKFFTNYNSRKGIELAENPYVSLAFYWESLNRQIRIEGHVSKLSEQESEDYFHLRPRGSQISCILSKQSSVIPGREYLQQRQSEMEKKYDGQSNIPKPDEWGGFLVYANVIEFWQGQTDRLHDRIRFRRQTSDVAESEMVHVGDDGWVYERLAP